MKRLTFALMTAFWFGVAAAQDDFVKIMNEIKLSGDYFTAHCRAETEAAAMAQCLQELMAQLGSDRYDEQTVRSKMQHLTKPGTPCRVFAYVRKDALQPKSSGPVAKKEEPPRPIVFKRAAEEQRQPEYKEPATQPAYKEPVTQPAYKEPVAVSSDRPILAQLVNDIKSRATIGNAYNAFKAKKELGMVADYGLLNHVPDMNTAYIVIFDATSDELSAILSPAASGCKNLLTGTQDSFSNYHGVKAFWFTLK